MTAARVAYLNARLLDPASGLDTTGALLIEDGKIADFGAELFKDGAPSVSAVIDCEGRCLAPGLIDMRVQLRVPGEEHKETIETASRAAAAGGGVLAHCAGWLNPNLSRGTRSLASPSVPRRALRQPGNGWT